MTPVVSYVDRPAKVERKDGSCPRRGTGGIQLCTKERMEECSPEVRHDGDPGNGLVKPGVGHSGWL